MSSSTMERDDQTKTYQRQNPTSKRSFLDAFGHKTPDASTIDDCSRSQRTAQGIRSSSTTPRQLSLKAEKRTESRTRGAVKGGSNGAHHHPDLDPYDLTSLDGVAITRPQISSSPKLRSPRANPPAPVIKTKPRNEGKARKTPFPTELQTTTNRRPHLARAVYGAATKLKNKRERGPTGQHQASASPSSSSAIAIDEPLAHSFSPGSHASSGSTTRGRLIDNLAHQGGADSSDVLDPQTSDSPSHSRTSANAEHNTTNTTNTTPRHSRMTKVPATVKFTYGSRRSMLREPSSEDKIQPLESSPVLRAPIFPRENDPFSLDSPLLSDQSDDDTAHKGAVQSIHELRQAGANNRFADAIDDLLDRVGLPHNESPSLRRGALLDIAVKLHQKPFLLQFRDYGAPRTLFSELYKEGDIVNAFALISSLLTLLLGNVPLPSYKSLQEEGICPLLERMLQHNDDICVIAGQPSLNVSRKHQPALSTLRAAVGGLGVWDPPPKLVSPRTLALKFIHLACQSPDGTDCMKTSEDITKVLFSLLQTCFGSNRLKNYDSAEGRDCLMAVSILEGLSVTTSTSEAAIQWTQEYLHIISAALDTALVCDVADFGPLENSILKLAMNATNNNPSAAVTWQDRKHLQNLTKASTTYFQLVKDEVAKGSWNGEVYNRLLLILGVMINLCEHMSSSHSLMEGDSLDHLMGTFLENSSSTEEADSVEKSQLNVVVGYIAIVLGYLCLSLPIRRRFETMNSPNGMDCLVGAIKEFISFYQSIDSQKDSSGQVTRLQGLVDALQEQATDFVGVVSIPYKEE